jgi:hypothetical protein
MTTIKTTLCAAALAMLSAGVCRSAPAPAPVVSQLHVLSIHVKDHATFDAVFLLCQDVLELPRVYGELSKPEDSSRRLYAGFSVGNAYLEPCGPYQDDAPFRRDQPARFHGLTFGPATTLADAAKALEDRIIPHSGVMAGGPMPYFVYVRDPSLTGRRLAVSLWEIQNTNDHAHLRFLRSSLDESKGGALGVQRLEEVRIGFREAVSLAQWGKFLAPAEREGDVWFVGQGPALRLVPGPETGPESIVLKVESLTRAEAALNRKNLGCEVRPDQIELAATHMSGLRIILREK